MWVATRDSFPIGVAHTKGLAQDLCEKEKGRTMNWKLSAYGLSTFLADEYAVKCVAVYEGEK